VEAVEEKKCIKQGDPVVLLRPMYGLDKGTIGFIEEKDPEYPGMYSIRHILWEEPIWMWEGVHFEARGDARGVKEGPIVSDGGPTDYYLLPEGATNLGDLMDERGMSHNRANIFKACYRLGMKEGTSIEYDLKKIKFFAERLLEAHKKGWKV